jgi:hypothetical protein
MPASGDICDAAPPRGEPTEPTEDPVELVVRGGRGGAKPMRCC